jgi:hypothetical protein
MCCLERQVALASALGEGNVNIVETLLLEAGASVLAVQAPLWHKHIDTTLRYAGLYDCTVAADYIRAMNELESRCDRVM